VGDQEQSRAGDLPDPPPGRIQKRCNHKFFLPFTFQSGGFLLLPGGETLAGAVFLSYSYRKELMTPFDWYIVLYALFILLGRIFTLNRRTSKAWSKRLKTILNDPTAIAMGAVSLVAFASPIYEILTRDNFNPNILSFLNGLLLMGVGWTVAFFANRDIGENWSPSIEKDPDQILVTHGVYRIVRHPLYLSGLLIFLGTQVYFHNTWSWLVLVVLVPMILLRIPREEKELLTRFGRDFQVYKKKTRALIPWVW
jgi:protein-S-isoprenylcysteine O-methyltransferase Ste14